MDYFAKAVISLGVAMLLSACDLNSSHQAEDVATTATNTNLTEISGDFDGDHKIDTARLEREAGRYRLSLKLASGNTLMVVEFSGAGEYTMRLRPPGKVIRACSKGYGKPCASGVQHEVNIVHDSIEINRAESARWLYYLNGNKVDKIFLTD